MASEHDTSDDGEPWIAVDLDGTLARYDGWSHDGPAIGDPVPAMLARVIKWIADGYEVRVMTARASARNPNRDLDVARIRAWTLAHVGVELPVTAEKDFGMLVLWDDRAVSVLANRGLKNTYGNHFDDPLTSLQEVELDEGSLDPRTLRQVEDA